MHLDRSLETNLDLGDLDRELALLPEEAGDLLRLLLRLLPLSLLASGDLSPMGLLSSAFTYRHFEVSCLLLHICCQHAFFYVHLASVCI